MKRRPRESGNRRRNAYDVLGSAWSMGEPPQGFQSLAARLGVSPMPLHQIPYFDTLLPLAACADPLALACTLDRMADLALAQGRAMFAEYLSHRAEAMREVRS